MTRDLTDTEKRILYEECQCPFCRCDDFFEGPHGGMQINWYCANCLAGFNLSPPALRYAQLIRLPREEQTIDPDSKFSNDMPEPELRKLFKRCTKISTWFEMLKSTKWGDDASCH